jgi:hypothetical protein
MPVCLVSIACRQILLGYAPIVRIGEILEAELMTHGMRKDQIKDEPGRGTDFQAGPAMLTVTAVIPAAAAADSVQRSGRGLNELKA